MLTVSADANSKKMDATEAAPADETMWLEGVQATTADRPATENPGDTVEQIEGRADAVWRAATPVHKVPRPLRTPASAEAAAATADAVTALGEPDAETSPAPSAAASRLEIEL